MFYIFANQTEFDNHKATAVQLFGSDIETNELLLGDGRIVAEAHNIDDRQDFDLHEILFDQGITDTRWISWIETEGFELGFDYKYVRDKIRDIIAAQDQTGQTTLKEQAIAGFDNLSPTDKAIACKHKIGTDAQILAALGGDDVAMANKKLLMAQFKLNMLDCRKTRMFWADTELQNELPSTKVIVMQEAGQFISMYTDYGYDGHEFGDTMSPGISDYLDAINGFEVGGLIGVVGLKAKTGAGWDPISTNKDLNGLVQQLKDYLFYKGAPRKEI